MNLPFTLPDWLPDWAFLLLALPVLLYALAFIIMPFSVFGVKARLDALEAQIDNLHEEIRNLAIRSSGMLGGGAVNRAVAQETEAYDTLPNFGRLKSSQKTFAEAPVTAPIPPAPAVPVIPVVAVRDRPLPAKQLPQRPPRRIEPRLD